ncbi:tail fiber domain-containing protein [Bartonella sp. F02]|uniref:tail fiber domain-containing protein n=1 Tax=Bartonella sp. F02 TaxID=2967262 RepID=UPI0022A90968|nr:tail fiber domain-containing protein [Bartonella sp. F02]MCZ2328879.1 tail fiber domain-containing protein [Bartonella sp. F02]
MRRKKTPQIKTTTQTNAPPVWAQNIFTQAAEDALDLYNKNAIGGNVYQGERHAGLSDITNNAIKGLAQAAEQYNNPTLNQWLKTPTQSYNNLSNMAKGEWIGKNNKFNEALNNALSKTSDAINQSMAGAGRYGSGAHTGVLADELGALATKATAQQYNQDVNNMMNANQMIDHSIRDQINAANTYYQGQSNAQNNALKGGMVQDVNQQNALNADREKWMEQDNQAWNQLERLLNAGKAAAGNYGTQTDKSVTIPSVAQNPLLDAKRLLGLVQGIIGLSDIRVKENIVRAGEKNGYPLYEFNYHNNPQRYRGVMAQDVVRLNPDAVYVDTKTDLFYVDYSQIGFGLEKVKPSKNKMSTFFKKIVTLLSCCFSRFGFLQKGHVS